MDMSKRAQHWIGFIEVVLSGLCFGLLSYLGKTAYALGIRPGEFLAIRFLGGSVVLFSLLILARKPWRLSRQGIFSAMILGVCGYALFSFLFFLSLQTLSSALAVLLLYQYPWMVAIAGYLFLNESIPRRQWFVFPILFFGLVLVIGTDYQVASGWGLFFGFLAAVFYSAYILLARSRLKREPAFAATAWIQLFAGSILLFIHFHQAGRVLEVIEVGFRPILLTILFPTVLAMSLFISGLQKLKSWEVSVLSTLEPLTTIVIGALFLAEVLSFTQVLGCGVILGALVLLGWMQRAPTAS